MLRLYPSVLGVVLAVSFSLLSCRNTSDSTAEAPDPLPPEVSFTPAPIPGINGASTPEPSQTEVAVESNSTEPNSTDAEAAQPETPDVVSTPLTPARLASLVAQDADAYINLRTEPTTQSAEKGYGLVGDRVSLLRSADGEGGYVWYYVRFDESGAEGWVRSDFIDASDGQTTVAASRVTTDNGGEGLDLEGACSGSLDKRFDSVNYAIFICELRDGGLRYIGHEKGANSVMITDDVTEIEDGYVAQKDDLEYHVSPNEIVIYQVDGDQYTQLSQESVQSVQQL